MSPIRMCVVCRERFLQSALVRLQCTKEGVKPYSKMGRSFYICQNCISSPKVTKTVARTCKQKEISLERIIEASKESVH